MLISFEEFILNEMPVEISSSNLRTPKLAFKDIVQYSSELKVNIGLPPGYILREFKTDDKSHIFYIITDVKSSIEFVVRHDKFNDLINTYQQVLINKYDSNLKNLTYLVMSYALKSYNIVSDSERTKSSNTVWDINMHKFISKYDVGIYDVNDKEFQSITNKSEISNKVKENFNSKNKLYYIRRK